MKPNLLLVVLTSILLSFSQSAVAQHADHDKEKGKGMSMTHLIITHEVEDADTWLAAWRGEDSRHKLFKAHGAKHVHVFQHADNPNLTGLVVAVGDMDKLITMLESEEGQANIRTAAESTSRTRFVVQIQ